MGVGLHRGGAQGLADFPCPRRLGVVKLVEPKQEAALP
jgi:hypothetical protein